MASEIPYSAQIAGIARIMCRERFLCFLYHLRKTSGFRGLLRFRLFTAVSKRQLTFPFWKEKLRLAHFFSPKRNPKIPGEKGRKKASWLSRNGDSHYRQKQCSI